MAYTRHQLATDGDGCKCGRRASVVHCISCGSFLCRVIKDAKLLPYTAFRDEKSWNCKKCDHSFPEHARLDCEAPVVLGPLAQGIFKLKRLASALEQGHPMTDDEDAIKKVITKMGVPIPGITAPITKRPDLDPLDAYQLSPEDYAIAEQTWRGSQKLQNEYKLHEWLEKRRREEAIRACL